MENTVKDRGIIRIIYRWPKTGRRSSTFPRPSRSRSCSKNSTLNSKTNITSVEEAASRLGLMKIDPSQITYIRLNESGALERQQSPVRQWTSFIYNGAVTILGTVK